jgi:DNA-3-methyladenine glycosylase I
MNRCQWSGNHPLMIRYHDTEWGVPVYDDRKLFEFLLLESAQAGLSWLTVLRKRENYQRAFDGFDPALVAAYTEADVQRLLADAGLIRNRAKITAAIENARRFLEVQAEFGTFAAYQWRFVGGSPIRNAYRTLAELPATSPISDAFSRDLKSRGFRFLGPTVVYAHMQAVGMVNDHTTDCFRFHEL